MSRFSIHNINIYTSGGVVNIVTKDVGFFKQRYKYTCVFTALENYLNTNNTELNRIKFNGKRLYEQEFSMHNCAIKYDALYHAP
jgi:hypothetical protein